MIIKLYSSPGDRNIINRAKTLIKELQTIETTDTVDIENPEILIDRDDTIIGFDYAEIPKFGRFYFLNSFQIVNGNQFKLFLESDTLESFASSIKASSCIAKRSTNHGNPEIEDELTVFKNIPVIEQRKCATGFAPDGSGYCYILTLGGK